MFTITIIDDSIPGWPVLMLTPRRAADAPGEPRPAQDRDAEIASLLRILMDLTNSRSVYDRCAAIVGER